MRKNETSLSDESFIEDQKRFRKLRKTLRQIENLLNLTRQLNDEENTKVSKRTIYRQQLSALNEKYSNGELNSDERLDENLSELTCSDVSKVSDQINESTNELFNQSVDFESNLNELSEKFESLFMNQSYINESKVEEEIHEEITSLEIIKNEKKDIKNDQCENKPEKVTETLLNKSNNEPVKKDKKSKPKPKILFDTFDIVNAHEDLIVSLDLCSESKLIVSGSRDTTVKVWSFENPQKIKLIHSFGGHSSSITFVKFWPLNFYQKSLENLSLIENDEELYEKGVHLDDVKVKLEKLKEKNDFESDDETEKESDNKRNKYPLVISSSLDCSLKIWDINKGLCIKEIYLYNRINHFQIHDTSFLIGLDGGKFQFWDNLTQIFSLKSFDDSDSVCCVKILDLVEAKKLYALSQTGIVKVYSILKNQQKSSSPPEHELESNVYSLLSASYSLKKNFKSFEIISEDQLLLINDNQAFVIFHDLKQKICRLISTNTNNYGITNCLFKIDNNFFISAYNIDDATSNINVFQYEKEVSKITNIKYEFTLEDNDSHTYCISTLSCTKIKQKNKSSLALASGSSKNLKLWIIENTNEECLVSKRQVKRVRMCKQLNFHVESNGEEEDDETEEEDVEQDEEMKNDKISEQKLEPNEQNKKSCSIQ